MTREMGKPLTETRGGAEGIDTAYYAATMGRQLAGRAAERDAEQMGDELAG
jgi:acyl-CoA reductase-like NAD-dependent aldehyde dehydrogenase